MPYPTPTDKDIARFWRKVIRKGPDDCWEWKGYHDPAGYCPFLWRKRLSYAHIFSFIVANGRAPKGDLDHKCRNRGCQNPNHHRDLSHQANVLAGNTIPARNAAKTHCLRGHEFTPENTHFNTRGERQCRSCCKLRAEMRAQSKLPKQLTLQPLAV